MSNSGMSLTLYYCVECDMEVQFFEGFDMECKGWDKHAFTAPKNKANHD